MNDLQIDQTVSEVLLGNRERYREVIALCEAKVRVVLAAIVPDIDSVDDLAQEVFVTAHAKLEAYRPGTDFYAWIKAIARNLAYNERKRHLRSLDFKQRYRAHIERTLEADLAPLAAGIGDEVFGALRECVAHLKERAREIVRAFYLGGRSSRQIAAEQGRTAQWVRLVLYRSRTSLADCLRQKGVFPSGS